MRIPGEGARRSAAQTASGRLPLFEPISSVRSRLTWLSPNNVRRQWRQARADTCLEWVTPHTFRETVAALIDKEADIRSVAAQLGHASEEVTDTYYIAKPVLAPDVYDILEQLGDGRVPDDLDPGVAGQAAA